MLCFVSFERRWRRSERIRYWVRARSVWRIESLRFRVALFVVAVGSPDEAARSSIASIYRHHQLDTSPIQANAAHSDIKGEGMLTCLLTLSIILSIKLAGHGRSSETARSATQKRVRSWWSRVADSGVWMLASRSTEARMSSMSMVARLGWDYGVGERQLQ